MAGFLSTTGQYVLKDTYSSYWQQATVDVTVSAAGKVDWKITMTNDHVGSSGRAVYLKVVIGDQTVQTGGYTDYSDPNTSSWRAFPTGHGTTKSGSFTTTASSLSVSIDICCMQSDIANGQSKSFTLTRKKWADVGVKTLDIEDKLNNTFTITAQAKEGTNNSVTSAKLKWGVLSGSSYVYETVNCPLSIGTTKTTKTVSIESSADGTVWTNAKSTTPTRAVRVELVVTGTYGDSHTETMDAGITQYRAPNSPGTPALTSASYQNSTTKRLTIKKPWTYSWTAATPRIKDTSPVKGYRIRVFKDGARLSHTEITGTSYTIPESIRTSFVPGNKIKVGVEAYTTNGKGEKIYGDLVYSAETEVKNSGTMHVKTGDGWKEGQVYVRAGGAWKEVQSVFVKANGGWKEST